MEMQCILPLGLGLKMKIIVRVCKHCECILRLELDRPNENNGLVCKTMHSPDRVRVKEWK